MGMSEKSENWSGRKWAFTAFLGIMLLHGLAIFLFTKGFLLTRSELSQHSECKDIAESPCFPPPHDHNANGSCWTKPVVDRLVIVVLDALRFDFVAPSTFFAEKKPWMDRLQVLHELAAQNRSSTRIFKAIADPPTTSLQRLKGLTTGGLPTFIDVGNSFGAPAILEDNLIRQVDNGCIANLLPTLYKDDWDVLIAHFLGVDHAGHIFGVDSDPMIEKLEQYNEVIKKVVAALESQRKHTLLLVMGDHGQTLNGDHGGGTAEEVETSIFALTLKKPQDPSLAAAESSSCQLDVHGRRVCIDSIQQLDFAATVSSLLGIPFPFGSIGRVMESEKVSYW